QSWSTRRPTAPCPLRAHHAWKPRFWRSAASRVSAYGIAVNSRRASAFSRRGSLSRTLRMRWFQQRCSRAVGKTATSAAQIPRWPSPMISRGTRSPRRWRSRKSVAQVSGRFPVAALDREHTLAAVPEAGDDHKDRGLVLLEAGLDVHAVHPEVDRLEVVQPPRPPRLVLRLPARFQPRD